MSSLKLEFVTETMDYLRPVMEETRTAEETAEAIIPDRTADVAEILCTGGTAVLRGRDVGEGNASVSAGVSAMVLVRPEEGGSPEVVELYIPLLLRFENPALRPGMLSAAQVTLLRMDGHMVNPRKVLVRATVAATLRAWEPCREEHAVEAGGQVEVHRDTLPLKLLTSLGERSYTVEDTVRLSPEGTGQRLADYRVELRHGESRLTGTRAVWKGTAEITALYLTEDGTPRTGWAQIPFSQYVDLEECQETDELRLSTCLTGADVELSADGGGLNVTLPMQTTAEVWAPREVHYADDMYALRGDVEMERETRSYTSLLDQQYLTSTGHGTIPGTAEQVLYTACVPGEMRRSREGENVTLVLLVRVQALTETGGELSGGGTTVELSVTTQAAENCRIEAEPTELNVAVVPGMEGLDVKLTGILCLRTWGVSELEEITGATLTETERPAGQPGLVIRRTSPGETLWEIAKGHRTTVPAIQSANALTGEPAEGTLLLIPGC